MRKKLTLLVVMFSLIMGMLVLTSTTQINAENIASDTAISTIFSDANVAKEIARQLYKKTSDTVSQVELDTILDLQLSSVSDLEGLQYLNNLSKVRITESSSLTDLSRLSINPKLNRLALDASVKVNLDDFARDFQQLEELYLGSRGLTDVTALGKMVNLKHLDILGNNVTDLSPLATLVNLEYLDVFSNGELVDISVIQNFSNLKIFRGSYTKIDDLSAFASLSKLEEIVLYDVGGVVGIVDVSPLKNLTNLDTLIVAAIPGIANIETVSHLPITFMNVGYNQIYDLTAFATGFNQVTTLIIDNQQIYQTPPIKVDRQGNILRPFHNILKNVDGSSIGPNVGYFVDNNGVSDNGTYNPSDNTFTWQGLTRNDDMVGYSFDTQVTIHGLNKRYSGVVFIDVLHPQEVSFESNGGSAVASFDAYQDDFLVLPTPNYDNHIFTGWYKDARLTQLWDENIDRVENTDVKLYAGWRQITSHQVTFESNGGSAVEPIKNVQDNSLITEPAKPTRDNYTFVGWYQDAALTNSWNFAVDRVVADTTLYAKWQEINQGPEVLEPNNGSNVSSLPNTGVQSNYVMYSFLFVIALAGIVIAMKKRNHSKNN